MKVYIILLILFPLVVLSQNEETEYTCQFPTPADSMDIYSTAAKAPSFPGGYQKQDAFVAQHFILPENYTPEIDYIDIDFVVEKNGYVNPQPCLRYKGRFYDDAVLMEAAIRMLEQMPAMRPGLGGRLEKPVNHVYTIRVEF